MPFSKTEGQILVYCNPPICKWCYVISVPIGQVIHCNSEAPKINYTWCLGFAKQRTTCTRLDLNVMVTLSKKLDNHLFSYSYIYITVKTFSLSFHESDSQTIFGCIADAGHTHVNYLTRDKNVGNSHNVLQSKSNHSFHVIEIILKTKLDW